MSKAFGAQLKRARLAEGLSQSELATKIDMSQAAISNWEVGTIKPPPGQLKKLERVLGKIRKQKKLKPQQERQGGTGAFGAWLRKVRSDRDMSVPELAEASSVSLMAIYNIEGGRSINPRAETRKRLATALKKEIPIDVQQEAEEEQNIMGLGPLTDFDPHNRDDRPSQPGVYVLYDVSDRPIYVGKAQNIARRVSEHEDAFWFKYPIVSNAAYVKIDDGDLRHQVEQVLIRFLKSNAVINKQSVVREA